MFYYASVSLSEVRKQRSDSKSTYYMLIPSRLVIGYRLVIFFNNRRRLRHQQPQD